MSLSKSKIIHIIIEAVLIIALGTYCIINLNKLNNRVSNLERELEAQRTRTNVLEAAVQEILKAQHPAVQKRVSAIVSNTSTMRQPPRRVQAQPVITQPPSVVQVEPKPPPANPFDSIMSMMAPMMSSMIVGGGDDESVTSITEIPDDISDADISDELNELKEVPRQQVKNNTVEIEEVESDDEVELELTTDEVATELNLQVEEVEVVEEVVEEVKVKVEMGQD